MLKDLIQTIPKCHICQVASDNSQQTHYFSHEQRAQNREAEQRILLQVQIITVICSITVGKLHRMLRSIELN